MKPLSVQSVADIKNKTIDGTTIVWATIVDGLFLIEVHRINYYTGRLHIFEILDERFIHCYEKAVALSYNAVIGPNPSNIDEWLKISSDYVDNLPG